MRISLPEAIAVQDAVPRVVTSVGSLGQPEVTGAGEWTIAYIVPESRAPSVAIIIAGVLVIGASIVLGFFAFLILGAVVLVTAAIVGVRVWWLERKFGRDRARSGPQPSRTAPGGVIEGEYKVVDEDREES